MAPISWLTETAAAKLLGLDPEQVQDLVDAGRLHEKWIHDHWAISAESVNDLLPAPVLATPSGDVLAAADDEDFMSGLLAGHPDTERVVPVRGGPALDNQTEHEYREEQKK